MPGISLLSRAVLPDGVAFDAAGVAVQLRLPPPPHRTARRMRHTIHTRATTRPNRMAHRPMLAEMQA